MKRYNIILVFVLAFSLSGFRRLKNDSISETGLGILANVNQGNSYITSPTDLGNIEPLWFEVLYFTIIQDFWKISDFSSSIIAVWIIITSILTRREKYCASV